jgi:hypothetical protein
MRTRFVLLVALAMFVPAVSAQFMIPDSGGDRIMLFDSFNGSLIDADWLTDQGAVGWAFSTPKEAVVVGSELWVADQIEDAIHRFDLGGGFLSSITTGAGGQALDNIRSLGFDGTIVYLTNSAGAIDDAVVKYDATGNEAGFFSLGTGYSPFDAEPFQGDLLVSGSDIDRWTTDGTFLSTFATGLGFPEQVVVLGDDSVIVANAIDSAGVEGLYHYNADGSLRAFVDTQSIGGPVLRGGNLLGNGNYILGTADGIWVAESDGGGGFVFDQVFADASGQYVTLIPEPASLALLAIGGVLALRRR